MVDSLSARYGIILVCTGSFHSDVTFWCFLHFWDHMGLRIWVIHFYFPIIIFGNFPIFGVSAKFCLVEKYIVFFWVQWFEFLWLFLHDEHPKSLFIGK